MTDRELRDLMLTSDGNGLSDEVEADLDAALSRTSFVAESVRSLPEEPLSLAWRSELNERLLALSKSKPKRSLLATLWRPALGLGLASILAIAFYPRGEAALPLAASGSDIEAQMVSAHQEAVTSVMTVGHGLASYEAVPTVRPASNVIHWEEADLGDL
ncbi:MAG: hypothetical protein HZC36_01780 [Armatimonadetes bacterium]|nr:hypothetical protein [Armatimonadota bacterium]